MEAKPYLRSIEFKRHDIASFDVYPFSLPIVRALDSLTFHRDVTFLVGANGSGKSTLIEAMAAAMGLNPEGGNKNTVFATEETHASLYRFIKTVKSYKKPGDYYFLRAESFYNVASYMDRIVPPPLQGYGGTSLHHRSHGEAFMAVLAHKLAGNGLYLMDEPEAALSPTMQMAALAEIHRLVRLGSQFIIATHSPIILSYPNATIYQIDDSGIRSVAYTETDHYRTTYDFLTRYETMLRVLLDNEIE